MVICVSFPRSYLKNQPSEKKAESSNLTQKIEIGSGHPKLKGIAESGMY